MKVLKRNKTTEEFQWSKIEDAIEKAYKANGLNLSVKEKKKFKDKYEKRYFMKYYLMKKDIPVESIHNDVEKFLMENAPFDVAKSYILYREAHKSSRFVRERIDYMIGYAESNDNAATASEVDANANVTVKNVANLEGEVYKSFNKVIQRQRMKDKLNELYPDVADQYEKDLNEGFIYVHDESSSPALKFYCLAATLYPLMLDGTGNIDGVTPSAPNDIQSFSGQVTNLVFLLSSQAKGACLYKDQRLVIKDNNITIVPTIKDLFLKYSNSLLKFSNYQGDWEYVDISNHDVQVAEDGKFVKVNKLYRRKYTDKIYKIASNDGKIAYTSKDHRFKHLFAGRILETKAETLEVGDTLFMNKDFSMYIDKTSYNFKRGWIIGLLCGDGCLTQKNLIQLSVNYNQEYLADIFNSYCQEIFNFTLNKSKGHHCWSFTKDAKECKEKVMEDLVGTDTITKHIDIENKPLDYLIGFLDGLFCADGSYSQGRGIAIGIINKELTQNILDICALIGVHTCSSQYNDARNNRQTVYTSYISRPILKYLHHTLKKQIIRNRVQSIESDAEEHYFYGYNAFKCSPNKKRSSYHNKWSNSHQLVRYNTDTIKSIEVFDNDDEYVYEIETETHWYNCGGFITHNCALGDYFIALNYYIIKEYGDDWYTRLNDVITSENVGNRRAIKDAIRKGMKQFIYGINQPAGNRSYNSPFTNVSFYDKYYFESLFGEFYYPDGTQPKWEAIDVLQRIFMELHRELRLVKPLTFPVTTMALLHDGKDFLDKEYKELCAEEWAKGGSFFLYTNDNATSLASCCFSEDTKFLWKSSTNGVNCTTFKEFVELPYKGVKENFKVYHNGSWVGGKVIVLHNRPMYKVVTENNNEYLISDNHINVAFDGEKQTKDLTTEDYLMFNNRHLEPVKENNEELSYKQGLLIGLFVGSGIFGAGIFDSVTYGYYSVDSFHLVLNEEKYNKVEFFLAQYGGHKVINDNNCFNVFYKKKSLVSFIEKWVNCTSSAANSCNKNVNLNCLLQSLEFRKGILDGWHITDGDNSNSCYTTNKELAFTMRIIINSLGLQSTCDINDRTDEYGRKYQLFCVRYYDNNSEERSGRGFKWKNNSIYWKIKSIERVEYNNSIYCIECSNQEEPYFTLPTGLITHNCRVLNEVSDNTFSSTTGMTGIMTGSCNVITLNINRIVQNYMRAHSTEELKYNFNSEEFKLYLTSILERVYKYQIAYKTMLYDMEDKGMYSSSNAGYIYLKKLYSTIGVIGYYEAAKFLGFNTEDSKGETDEYVSFLQLVLGTIKEQNKIHSIRNKKYPHMFNSEAVPGENLGVKFYEKDKTDGYWVPEEQNLYNCYFYNPWGEETVFNKLKLHGKKISSYCDGGQAAHINLQEDLTKEQYINIMMFAIKEGVNYFTFNIPFSECKDCHHVVHAPVTECPICHSKNIDWWTRIIGYLRPISAFSNARQIEADKRFYNKEV